LRKISFILPVLNEAGLIVEQLQRLQAYRQKGHEVLLIDGGSTDGSAELAMTLADVVETTLPGRSRQMNHGAELASGDIFLFLHIDTSLPEAADALVLRAMEQDRAGWGWFDVRLSNCRAPFRLIAWMMNVRARLSAVCTGDQALFVGRELFAGVGMFPALPLMEDIAISKKLRGISKPVRIVQTAVTSSRRWEERGLLKTVLLMWQLRLLYFLGVSPSRLVIMYYPNSTVPAGFPASPD
jgi:rSAM/selenodomain-associated transferase 2